MTLTDVPLTTGHEPLDKLFVQSGCAVCHTIPGIEPAKGREGPKLVLGTNGPMRLADPNYKGTAESVREYIQESILNPGAYVVPGYFRSGDASMVWETAECEGLGSYGQLFGAIRRMSRLNSGVSRKNLVCF